MTARVALLALCLVVAASPLARAEPVAVGVSGDQEAEVLAVSARGNATCTSSTCVAVSALREARAGCHNATSCEDDFADCAGFACLVVAATVLGDARAYAYCDTFGQVCAAVALGPDPSLYACTPDVTTAVYCRGLL